MFAPEPIQHDVVLEAEVRHADGRRTLWRPPRRDAFRATLGYRLESWARRVVRDEDSELWRPAASWIRRRHEGGASRPVRVTLRRRWRAVRRPRAPPGARVWNEFDFYTLALRGRG